MGTETGCPYRVAYRCVWARVNRKLRLLRSEMGWLISEQSIVARAFTGVEA
jgi:hypothetical protein